MKGILENQNKTDNEKKLKIFYIGIIAICVIAIIVAIVLQVQKSDNESEISKLPVIEENINEYQEEFDNMFHKE